MSNNNSMKKPGDILILIGSILQSIGVVFTGLYFAMICFFASAGYYFDDDYGYGYGHGMGYDGVFWPLMIMFAIGGIISIAYVVFSWIAYNKAKGGSKGWSIYGIVQAVICGNVVSIVGYVFEVIAIKDEEVLVQPLINVTPAQSAAQPETIDVQPEAPADNQ